MVKDSVTYFLLRLGRLATKPVPRLAEILVKCLLNYEHFVFPKYLAMISKRQINEN